MPMPATKERQRASRACDFCKRKRIRCSGERPCQLCVRDQRDCSYDAPYARGKNKRKGRRHASSHSDFSQRFAAVGTANDSSSQYNPQPVDKTSTNSGDHLSTPSGGTQSSRSEDQPPEPPLVSSRTSPEPGESDVSGHFVGASSGLSLLLRLQRRLRQEVGIVSEAADLSLGDPPLPDFESSLFSWPTRQEAELLVRTYFDLASPTHRFLHRPTIESWLQQLSETGSISEPCSHGKAAVLLSMFAQATGYLGASVAANPRSLQFFQAAEKQLSLQGPSANLIIVQALLGCCFYTLTCSRLNHCWDLFGTAARIIQALGLHRRKPRCGSSSAAQRDVVEIELRKRLFWCAYVLDKYLATIFGRPCALNDDDTDQDMPAIVDDSELTSEAVTVTNRDSMSIMLGPVCHQKLGQLLSSALKRLYGVTPLDQQTQLRAMSELGLQVAQWRDSLPAFLNPEKVDSRLLRPIFQRQSNLLSLASGQLEILIYRSCLLGNYKTTSTIGSDEISANVQRCLSAAMAIVSTIDVMAESGQLYPVSWFTHYQAFCAVVILFTYTIQARHRDPASWLKYFQAAEKCQAMIANVPGNESLAHRLILIMEEYRSEVVTQVHLDSPHAMADNQQAHLPPNADNMWLPPSMTPKPDDELFTELPDWEQLNSLALDTGFVEFDLSMLDPGIV